MYDNCTSTSSCILTPLPAADYTGCQRGVDWPACSVAPGRLVSFQLIAPKWRGQCRFNFFGEVMTLCRGRLSCPHIMVS